VLRLLGWDRMSTQLCSKPAAERAPLHDETATLEKAKHIDMQVDAEAFEELPGAPDAGRGVPGERALPACFLPEDAARCPRLPQLALIVVVYTITSEGLLGSPHSDNGL
jgi:hypothetical protein